MRTVADLIRKNDPLNHEPIWSPHVRQGVRQKVLQEVGKSVTSIPLLRQPLIIAMAMLCVVFVAGAVIIPRVELPLVQAQASVRFDVRLAEESPTPGLQQSKGAGGTIYLHGNAIVSNIDIASARVISGSPSGFAVDVTFTPSGAEKMLRATRDHIGKPVAILIDGQVVSSLRLKSAIGSTGLISGNFTRSEADRMAGGMIGR